MKQFPRWLMVFLIICIVGLLIYAAWNSSPPPQHLNPAAKVTKEGTLLCLPPKDEHGPQVQSCALGIKTDNGQYFALVDGSGDYSLVSGVPTGKRIKVTGSLHTALKTNLKNDGVLTATSIIAQ
jgi:hypothetical protein